MKEVAKDDRQRFRELAAHADTDGTLAERSSVQGRIPSGLMQHPAIASLNPAAKDEPWALLHTRAVEEYVDGGAPGRERAVLALLDGIEAVIEEADIVWPNPFLSEAMGDLLEGFKVFLNLDLGRLSSEALYAWVESAAFRSRYDLATGKVIYG